MLALIMAGGRGTRLEMGEKSLVKLCGRPLIEYVLTGLKEANLKPIVVTTPSTPYTANYCRANGIDLICTRGAGYIDDIIEAVTSLEEKGPVLIACTDIPGIRVEHITLIFSLCEKGGRYACSVWVPSKYIRENIGVIQYSKDIEGISAVPVGLNILQGEFIDSEQSEISILIDDPALAFNINTRSELKMAESFFSSREKSEKI